MRCDVKTYWNGEKAECKKCSLIVADSTKQFPQHWAKHLIGKRVDAVEVIYGGHKWYLYNDDGTGWIKVTLGKGSPMYGHAEVSPENDSVKYSEVKDE